MNMMIINPFNGKKKKKKKQQTQTIISGNVFV